MIVIINGVLGAGKSQTAWCLLDRFDRAAVLDVDYLVALRPFSIHDPKDIAYGYDTLCAVARHHHEHGFRDLIVNWVFESAEELSALRRRLAEISSPVLTYRLVCDPDAIARRIRQRNTPDLEWELGRFREHLAVFEREAARGDVGLEIDTTHLSATEAAAAIYDDIHAPVVLADYDPAWPDDFETERRVLETALGDRVCGVHHFGSTAVPGLTAKPIIDILVTVPALDDAVPCIAPLRDLGYRFVDHPQNVDRRFFRKGTPKTHHLHVVEAGGPVEARELAFRDALRARYADLKQDLLARFPHDSIAFSDAKGEFMRALILG